MGETPEAFWGTDQDRYPRRAVFLKNLPELLGAELMHILPTWFGVLWPGNPVALGTKVLYGGSRGNPLLDGKFIRRGTVTVRSIS